jgi:RHS repeat-associated protein
VIYLVAYHSPLTVGEQGSSAEGSAGAIVFRVSPSPKAAQVLLDSGYENIRLYPFPEQLERGLILGPAGGTVTSPDGVEVSLPEGALASRTVVKGRLLSAQELATYSGGAIEGYQLLAGVRVELTGATLARPATLRLPTPAGTPADATGDKRVVLTSWIDQPEDSRGAFARLVARGNRLAGAGAGATPERLEFAPEADATVLPLEGVVREGIYLVLRANASIGYATGFVKAVNGFGYAAARVTTPGLGTADLSLPGGRYTSVVTAGAARVIAAKHPTLDEQGTATIASLAAEAVVAQDITVTPVPPTITSLQPADGSTDQPTGTPIVVAFSKPLDPASVSPDMLTLEVLYADGRPTGIFLTGTVGLSPDRASLVLSPSRPLPGSRYYEARFTGGVRDQNGTPYVGGPRAWRFASAMGVPAGGQVNPSKIHILLPSGGTAQIIGDPGAVPAGWGVSADIEGPVICPSIATVPANSQGAFTYTAGCPPTVPVTLESRVHLKVFAPEPGGTFSLAATIKLGPFVTADGRGVVAPPNEATTYTTPEGINVEIPDGAFEVETLVTLTKRAPSSITVPLNPGLEIGAAVDVEFQGTARKTLRVRVPLEGGAIAGRMVFVGEPISLAWGERLKLLDLGKVVEIGGVKHASNYLIDQPAGPSSLRGGEGGRTGLSIAGRQPFSFGALPTNSPYCLATLPCAPVCPNAPTPPNCVGFPPPPAPPPPPPPQGCTICACSNLMCAVFAELTSRASAVFVSSIGAEFGALTGISAGLDATESASVIYSSIADTFVFAAPPFDWTGHFILPYVPGVPFTVVRRDTATGWITGRLDLAALTTSPSLVDVGSFDPPKQGPPVLVDGSPLALTLFNALDVPTGSSQRCADVRLEVQACGYAGGTAPGQTVVSPSTSGAKLAEDSRVSLYDLAPLYAQTPAPPTGPPPAIVFSNGSFPSLGVASSGGDPMLLLVGPGDVEPESVIKVQLSFDRALDPASKLTLKDCGPLSGPATCTDFPLDVSLSADTRTIVGELKGILARGHRYELGLVSVATAVPSGTPIPYLGPTSFTFATRKDPQGPIGETDLLSLGDTDVAWDFLRFGNLLLVGSASGNLVALDLTDSLFGNQLKPKIHAVSKGLLSSGFAMPIRAMATDGHERAFYTEGAYTWAVKAVRLEDVRAAQPSATCTLGPRCFEPVVGGAKVSYSLGTSTMLASEYLATHGGLPTGSPVKLDVVVEDALEDEAELADFYAANAPTGGATLAQLTPDDQGYYTFDVKLDSTRHPIPAIGGVQCVPPSASPYKWQRATVQNLTMGQSFSFDVPIATFTSPSVPGSTLPLAGKPMGIRARRGDRLRVKYNIRAIGYVAIVGGGISVVDLNRFYDVPMENPTVSGTTQVAKGECGRRLTHYAGSEASIPACGTGTPEGIALTTSVAALGVTGDGTRGSSDIDVYSSLRHFGAVHSQGATDLSGVDFVCLASTVPGRLNYDDVAVAADVTWEGGPAGGGDLLFVTLNEGGILTYDISYRNLLPIGRFAVTGQVNRVQVDEKRGRLYAGGVDTSSGIAKGRIWAWDISRAAGQPPASGPDPRLLFSLEAPWHGRHIGIDEATGLLYTWSNGTNPGGKVYPVDDPKVLFLGRYLPDTLPSPAPAPGTQWPSVFTPASRFVPMGIPSRPTVDEETLPANRQLDEQKLTAAFKLRVGLPGSLGERLTVKVQALRALPDARNLSHENLGAFVAMKGGPGWPERDGFVTLRRVSKPDAVHPQDPEGRNGRLTDAASLYESEETVVLLADPRATGKYWATRQRIGATQAAEKADEDSQCRRCERALYLPAYTPPPSTAEPLVEVLAGGPYVRAFLSVDPSSLGSVQTATQQAIDFFDSADYRAPTGVAQLSAHADEVPSVAQVSLAEPARSPAFLSTEAGGAVSLTSGEGLLSQVDHAVAGRGLSFAFERSYRSGVLGYGPLGAAGWGSPLHAHIRELVLEGGINAQKQTIAEYHDGEGQVFRFVSKDASGVCPTGTEEDTLGSYCAPEGLYLRLQRLGKGWRLIGRTNDTAVFDEGGRLTEISDRFRRGEPDPTKQGSTLRLLRDPAGQLAEVEDDLGRSYAFRYHEDPADARFGLLRELEDFDGRKVAFTYDGSATASSRKLLEVELPQVQTAGGLATPKLTYDYATSTLTNDAPHHGPDFSPLRLIGFKQPTGTGTTEPRLLFDYDPPTGRVKTVSVPGSQNPSQRVAWTLTTPGATAAPAAQVTVTQPFGHVVTHDLPQGRLTKLTESAPALLDGDPTPPIGALPTSQTLETTYGYLTDGRLETVTFPDKSQTKLTLASAAGNRMERPNVTKTEQLLASGIAGTAAYAATTTEVTSFVDNIPQTLKDPRARSITTGVAQPSQTNVVSEHAADPKQTRVGGTADYDAFGRVKSGLSGTSATQGGTVSVDFKDDYRGKPSAGFPSKVTTGSGPSLMSRLFQYDNQSATARRGNVTRVDTSSGTASTFKYDQWDRVVEETHGLSAGGAYNAVPNATVQRSYDAAGRLIKVTRQQDPIGPVETLFDYNERDQVTVRTDKKVASDTLGGGFTDAITRYAYDAFGRLEKVTSPQGIETKYTYDSAGRVLTEQTGSSATSGIRRFAYDREGRLVYATDGDQGIWRGKYDAWGRLYREELPTGAVVLREFDEAGGLRKQQTYSGDPSLPTSELLTETLTNVTSYGAVNEVTEALTITPRTEKVTRKVYDEAGRLARVTSGAPAVQRTDLELSYDESDRVVAEKDAGGNRTEYAYTGSASWPDQVRRYEAVPGLPSPSLTTTSTFTRDALGRVTKEDRGNGSTVITTYDQAGNVRTQQSSIGSLATMEYDGQGKPIKVTKPSGNVSEYAYDRDGRLLLHRTNLGTATNTTEYQYDVPATGRLSKLIRPDGTFETFAYNPDDTLAVWRTRSGIDVAHAYDAANRLLSRTPNATTALPGAPLTDSGDTFTYDKLSRLLSASRPLSPAQGVAFTGYDAVGRPASEVVGSRAPVLRQYDVWSRQTAIQLPSGVGKDPSSPFAGYQRSFDNLDRLVGLQSLDPTSPTPPIADLGATWAWGGSARLYSQTTNGALKTAHRYSYLGSGLGPQPGGTVTTPWRLGIVSVGSSTSSTPATSAPAQLWGQMGYGYRAGDGAKLGREVLSQTPSNNLFANQGFAYKVDNALRLTDALSGQGAMDGTFTPVQTSKSFTIGYGDGDEVLSMTEASAVTPPPPGTPTQVTQQSGDEGRITQRNAVPIAYDPEGHRTEDDRFRYSWNWRGELVAIDVKPLWAGRNAGDPAVTSPYPEHQVRLERDALGRVFAKLHLGPRPPGATDDCTRAVLSKRELLWDGDTLLSEASYGPSGPYCNQTPAPIQWRKSYVPGASGLDDAVQMRVEVYDASGSSVVSDELYDYVRDEQGTVQSLVREPRTGTGNPSSPEVVVRYLYSPYGEAYAEAGAELRRATFDETVLSVTRPDGTNASQAPGTNAPGAFRFVLSTPLDPTTIASGVTLEKLTGTNPGTVPPAELAIGLGTSPEDILVLPLQGWERGASYRVKLTSSLRDTLGRPLAASASASALFFAIPQTAPVLYDVGFPAVFENHLAAGNSAGGAFPGGQPHLWQGAYTCEITGLQFKRARVYDPRTASWLSPDPLGDVDSPSVYAYVAGRPYVGVDPLGLEWTADSRRQLHQLKEALARYRQAAAGQPVTVLIPRVANRFRVYNPGNSFDAELPSAAWMGYLLDEVEVEGGDPEFLAQLEREVSSFEKAWDQVILGNDDTVHYDEANGLFLRFDMQGYRVAWSAGNIARTFADAMPGPKGSGRMARGRPSGRKSPRLGTGRQAVAPRVAVNRPAPKPENYRGRFNAALAAAGRNRLPDDWDAHHRIPQVYKDHPEFKSFDFNDPANVRGVRGSRSAVNTHQDITNEWEAFRASNPNATRAQIEAFADQIDAKYQQHWY